MEMEAEMSELTLIAENILNTMQALDEAHHASNELLDEANHEKFDAFKVRMAELQDHLSKLKIVLDNEEAYAMDELIEALDHAYTSHEIRYRRTSRMRA
jgi:cellobiose-specific phosphotransferase system component IIA